MSDDELPAIEFRNVYLSFDGRLVLNNISFTLAAGEMIFLTGISGSGKSVLLRLAMGLLKPDSGQIFIEGREIEQLDESELLAIRCSDLRRYSTRPLRRDGLLRAARWC